MYGSHCKKKKERIGLISHPVEKKKAWQLLYQVCIFCVTRRSFSMRRDAAWRGVFFLHDVVWRSFFGANERFDLNVS